MEELPSFEYLNKLAKEDKEKFDILRRSIINNFLDSEIHTEEEKLKLKRLQFQIDGIIIKSKNPLQSTILISNLMNEKVNELNNILNKPEKKKNPFSIIKGGKKEYKKEF